MSIDMQNFCVQSCRKKQQQTKQTLEKKKKLFDIHSGLWTVGP